MGGERRKIAFDSSIHAFYRGPLFTCFFFFFVISLVRTLFTVPVSVNASPHNYIGRPLDRKEDTKRVDRR